uniref:Uncharacterized protein n=1 Tax=Rhizophora mucronata TaxID=61149 RepID=A0A2P2NS84_RHIMU
MLNSHLLFHFYVCRVQMPNSLPLRIKRRNNK